MIPFWMMPGSWGLKGKTYEIAKAEYELEGEELDYRLIEIQYDVASFLEKTELLPIDYLKHKLALDLEYGKIDKNEHDSQLATLEERPYVHVKSSGFDFTQGLGGFWMELSWNRHFIDFLEKNNYSGTENQIIDEWQADIYRSQIMEQELGPEPDFEGMTNVVDLGNGKTSYE